MIDSRVQKLVEKLEEKNLDAYFVIDSSNIFYLSGLRVEGFVLITRKGERFLITSPMYQEEILEKKRGWKVLIGEDRRKLELSFVEILDKLEIKNCGFDARTVSYELYQRIKRKYKKELVPCDNILKKIRAVKSKKEIELIKKAAGVVLETFDYLKKILTPSITEKDLAREATGYILKKADEIAFPPIVLFGSRTSLPHGRPQDVRLQDKELVLIDIGAKVEGYCSDITRTFILRENNRRWRKIYRVIEEVREKVIKELAKPGIKCMDIEKFTREKITASGYKEAILHGTGHGVGLDVHEEPLIGITSESVLEEGMVITVDPGIYLPGKGGIRIEDMVLITSKGGQILP
ncbi:aminopeptidase P family protein [Candidatus Aerophobetes bacterium]|nr:aminopeptidase P family protein [Candidatus Aerophobetes bacterium]